MDSGNSGSLQSSSGGEEECDSRATIHDSSFITTAHQHQQPQPPFNNYIYDQNQINNVNNPLFFTPNQKHQLLNLDSVIGSKTLPSFSDSNFFPSPSQPAAHAVQFSPVMKAATASTNPHPPARNPKKRTRASRRAPTTVLTTDTNNFRAMVQEFTGIPAPPFTSTSSVFPTFDLFGRPSAMIRSNTNNFDNLLQLPSNYLLSPFTQKLQSSPSSSSSISSLLDSSNLLNTMQNTITFPSNNLNHPPFLNPKTTQTQIHEYHTKMRNGDQVASGNWDGDGVGGGDDGNYTNGKELSGIKCDQGFIEPWICS